MKFDIVYDHIGQSDYLGLSNLFDKIHISLVIFPDEHVQNFMNSDVLHDYVVQRPKTF